MFWASKKIEVNSSMHSQQTTDSYKATRCSHRLLSCVINAFATDCYTFYAKTASSNSSSFSGSGGMSDDALEGNAHAIAKVITPRSDWLLLTPVEVGCSDEFCINSWIHFVTSFVDMGLEFVVHCLWQTSKPKSCLYAGSANYGTLRNLWANKQQKAAATSCQSANLHASHMPMALSRISCIVPSQGERWQVTNSPLASMEPSAFERTCCYSQVYPLCTYRHVICW